MANNYNLEIESWIYAAPHSRRRRTQKYILRENHWSKSLVKVQNNFQHKCERVQLYM